MGEASEQVTEKLMSKGLMAIPMIMNSPLRSQITLNSTKSHGVILFFHCIILEDRDQVSISTASHEPSFHKHQYLLAHVIVITEDLVI